jgi:hypothetical protein
LLVGSSAPVSVPMTESRYCAMTGLLVSQRSR